MEDEALEVLSGVVEGDESSVEGWYLGGWGLWLLAERGEGGRQAVEGASARAEAESAVEDGAETFTKIENDNRGPNSSSIQAEKDRVTHLRDSRTWFNTCLSLAAQLDYEDDRLRDHAQELVQEIERLLLEKGLAFEDDDEDEDEEDGWEGVDSSEEDEMESNSNEDQKSFPGTTTNPLREGGIRGKEEAEKVSADVIMSGI